MPGGVGGLLSDGESYPDVRQLARILNIFSIAIFTIHALTGSVRFFVYSPATIFFLAPADSAHYQLVFTISISCIYYPFVLDITFFAIYFIYLSLTIELALCHLSI